MNIEFGSYAATVSMKTPTGEWIGVDVCIATEIGRLWLNGITTVNSCCGHGRLPPSVVVADDDVGKMRKLGYESDAAYPDREDIFILTGKPLPVRADNPHYEAWQKDLARARL